MKRPLSVAAALVLAVACTDQSPTAPSLSGPLLEISDGFSTPPRPDFYFLFPIRNLSQQPPAEGFNPNLAPVVKICRRPDLQGDGTCTSREFKLTTTSGTLVTLDGISVRLDGVIVYPSLKTYLASWNTKNLGLQKDEIYRIRVLVGNTELGFVDAYVVETIGQLKKVDRSQYYPLLKNSILPIPFWIGVQGNSETVNLSDGQEDQVELRDQTTGQQIGVLSIPPGQQLEPGSSGQITFTLQQCDELNIDIPQFGDCLRITADPPIEQVVGQDGFDPPATISICRTELIGPRNELITLHRQDDAGNVYALPHADDDCEDIIPAPGQQAPDWDVGQQPAGDSPYTSLFRNALPAKMDYVNAGDAERTAAPGAALPTAVKVTNAAGGPVAGAQVTFTVTQGTGTVGSSTKTVTTGTDGVAQVTWTVDADAGPDGVEASGRGIASPSNNGPDPSFDPFWPGLHVPGVTKSPVLLGTGIVEFTAFTAQRNTGTVQLDQGGSVEFRDDNNTQIGVLTIPAQQTSQTVTFTLTQCTGIDVDLPTFGPCLEITATPALTEALSPPATVSICSGFVGATGIPQNPLITLHRQDDEGNVYALPHADDDCAEVVAGGPSRGPQWDVGQQPAGDSPFTSKFQNALPAKMDYVNPDDAARTATPGAELPTAVKVTDANNGLVAGAHVTFTVTDGGGSVSTPTIVTTGDNGIAQVTWTLGAGAGTNRVQASGRGIASPDNNGPLGRDGEIDNIFDPFWPGLHQAGVEKDPVLLGTGTLEFVALSLGLVSKWPGDGTAEDVVGPNEGTLRNGATFASGLFNQAFSFDGVDDFVSAPGRNIDGAQQLTVATWVKLASEAPVNRIERFITLSGEKVVLRHDGENSPGQLHFYVTIDGQTQHIRVNDALRTGCFHYVAGTYDGSTMRLYLDGVEVGSHGVSGTVATGNGVELSSAATSPAGPEALNGLLDEVEIHNRALSQAEVQTRFEAGGAGKCTAIPLEVVVIGDFNVFDNVAADNADNPQFYKNFATFVNLGSRATQTKVIWYEGHGSLMPGHRASFPSTYGSMDDLSAALAAAGYTFSISTTTSLTSAPPDVKVLFIVVPTQTFTSAEATGLRTFVNEGGRLVLVSDNSGFYSSFGTSNAALNDLLIQLGAAARDAGGSHDCGYVTLSSSSLRSHQLTMNAAGTGLLSSLRIACSAGLQLGASDFAFLYNSLNTTPLGAVAKLSATPPSADLIAQSRAAAVRASLAPVQSSSDGDAAVGVAGVGSATALPSRAPPPRTP